MTRSLHLIAGRALLYTVLGAITTIAVAWGIAVTVDFRGSSPTAMAARKTTADESATARYDLALARYEAFGATHYWSSLSPTPKISMPFRTNPSPEDIAEGWAKSVVIPLRLRSIREGEYDPSLAWLDITASGWPIRALWCDYAYYKGPERLAVRGGWVVKKDGAAWPPYSQLAPRAVSLRPILMGIIGDTALYATAWWLLALALGAVPRSWRVQRGRCALCGYNLTGITGPCPECGIPSPDHAP